MDLKDGIANGWGVLAAIALFVVYRLRVIAHAAIAATTRRRRWVQVLSIVSGACLVISWMQPFATLLDIRDVYRRFPILGSFESKYELERWYFRGVASSLSTERVSRGERSLRIDFQVPPSHSEKVCGATLFELQQDWTAMRAWKMDVRMERGLADQHRAMTVQLVSQSSDGANLATFSQRQTIAPDRWQTITITRADVLAQVQPFDFSRMRYVDVFFDDPRPGTSAWLDHVRLVLDESPR